MKPHDAAWLPILTVAVMGQTLGSTPSAKADNKRLNDSVVANVYTVQHNAGCTNDEMGVWSENSLDRSVLVAMYGAPADRASR
jgi:hypothetical protein